MTLTVYNVVADGDTETPTPLVREMLPGVITAVPPEKSGVIVVELPTAIDAGDAVNPVIAGAGTSVTTASLLNRTAVVPLRVLVTRTLYVPAWVTTYELEVAPEIVELFKYHWYVMVAEPEELTETASV